MNVAPTRGDVSVTQVLTEQVGIPLLVQRGSATAGSSCPIHTGWATVTAAPMRDSCPRQTHLSGDIGCGQTGAEEPTSLVDLVDPFLRVHSEMLPQGTDKSVGSAPGGIRTHTGRCFS
jgi:hypothetical protein